MVVSTRRRHSRFYIAGGAGGVVATTGAMNGTL
jgi:hypothetical protein